MSNTKPKPKNFDYITNELFQLEEENKTLRQTLDHLKNELEKFKNPPFIVCEVKNILDGKALIKLRNGNEFLVEISDNAPKNISSGEYVLADQKSLTIVDKIPKSKSFNVENFVIVNKPVLKWKDVGGLKEQINELKEVIELPLKKPDLFKEIGIIPPKGVLLYGPPGTGKTLMAKAVASSTNSTFIEIVGSELVQKFIGEGAKLVKEIFDLAREKAPSIIFIDELDAIASVRMDLGTSGEREVQRTFMQLLAEIDGFDSLDNVKIIGASNREDILDPAITRPGRLDRLIEVPLPNEQARTEILKIHSKNMKLVKVDPKKIVEKTEGFSGADLKSVCTEAGYFAIRENKRKIEQKHFTMAINKLLKSNEDHTVLNMFG